MYRRYYNEYEKKAQELKKVAPPVPKETPEEKPLPQKYALRYDDILILGLIFFLIKEGNADKMLILALGFIFISGF